MYHTHEVRGFESPRAHLNTEADPLISYKSQGGQLFLFKGHGVIQVRTYVRCGKPKDESEFNWRNIKKGICSRYAITASERMGERGI